MHKTIFLDTNIFLHYQMFDQINWLDILKVDSIVIVVPPVTLRELNKHKELHARSHVRRRAGVVLTKLSKVFETTSSAYILDGVNMHLEDRDPTINFPEYQLNPEIQDDHLIATIIMYHEEIDANDIKLITSDDGLTLIAKSRRHGIATVKIPDKYKIPYSQDPSEKKIKDLERELNELKLQVPQLALTLENGDQHITYYFHKPLDIQEHELTDKLNEVKIRYPQIRHQPKQAKESPDTAEPIKKVIDSLALLGWHTVDPQEIAKYNNKLIEFYQAYDEYLREELKYENLKRRTIILSVLVTNEGTAPAEDIDVYMHFPDGFEVLSKSELPKQPAPPQPPSKPLTKIQKLNRSFDFSSILPPRLSTYITEPMIGSALPAPNVSSPNIQHINSYNVDIHVNRVKHHLHEKLEPLYVVFESFDHARSFSIGYRILAANLPNEVTGQLHIVIQKQEEVPPDPV